MTTRTIAPTTALAVALLVGGLLVAPGASAQPGALSQLPGSEGCISHDGSGPCTDADTLDGAFSVAVNRFGKHVYVAAIDTDTVAVLARDKKTGALTQLPSPQGCISEDGSGGLCADGRGLIAPLSVAASPDGKHVYVASFQRDPVAISSLAVLARDRDTGGLTQLPGEDGCISDDGTNGLCTDGVALRGTHSVAVANDGKHVYVASETSSAVAVFARNRTTGALTQLPGAQGCISEGGSGGLCTEGHALLYPTSVAVSGDGRFVYAATRYGSGSVVVLARDKRTGALTQLPGPDGCISEDDASGLCTPGRALSTPTSIAVSKDGRNVYVTSPVRDAVAVLTRATSGGLTQQDGPDGCVSEDGSGGLCTDGTALNLPYSVVVSPDGKQVYVGSRDSNAVAVFVRNKETGALSQLPAPQGCISEDGTGGLCDDGRALDNPRSVVVSNDGKHVYVATQGSDAVAVLQRQKK